MSGSLENGSRAYTVELDIDVTDDAAERIHDAWDWLLGLVSKLGSAGQLLLAMPALQSGQPAQSTPLSLRWVGIRAADAEEAAAQARDFLDQLGNFLPPLRAPVRSVRVHEES
jgi:hypothetical protein